MKCAVPVILVATVAACTAESDGFRCERDNECGADGVCAVTGYCAFASDSCDSGWRYGSYAAPLLSDRCVDDGAARYGRIATGSDHTCALQENGDVWCWGRNDHGQLGNRRDKDSAVPVRASGVPPAQQVAAGELHSCALSAGQVWCWGSNEFGQLGDGTTDDSNKARRVAELADVVELGLGEYHSCARRRDGSVWCWGKNREGQLGDGSVQDSPVPVPALVIGDALGLAVDGHHTCAQRASGEVMCWGSNEFGQLGNGEQRQAVTTPTDVPWLNRAVFVAAGGDHLCGLTQDNQVCCAGNNEHGQLGDGTRIDRDTPVPVKGLSNVAELVAGEWFNCARSRDGSARCWGRNEQGELGFASEASQARAGPRVGSLRDIVQLSAGERHACAQTRDGCIWCWGSDEYGQLGAVEQESADSDEQDRRISPTPRAVQLSCW